MKELRQKNNFIVKSLEKVTNELLDLNNKRQTILLNFKEKDLFNALFVFHCLAYNHAKKTSHYQHIEDMFNKMDEFKRIVQETYGFNTQELTNKILGEEE